MRVLILPQSVAMSKAECDAVRRFVKRGGTVIADCRTALMDEHCKLLGKGQLDDLFGIRRKDLRYAPGPAGLSLRPARRPAGLKVPRRLEGVPAAEPGIEVAEGATALYRDADGTPAVIVKDHGKGRTVYLNAVITDYHRWRLRPPEGKSLRRLLAGLFAAAGVEHQYRISRVGGGECYGVEVHPYRGGHLRILGLHRNYQLRVSELGPPRYRNQAALEEPMELRVQLPQRCAVYDLRARKYLGMRRTVTVPLGKYVPTILTMLPEPVKAVRLIAPARARLGQLVRVRIHIDGPKLGDVHAVRVRVLNPAGEELEMLTRTLLAKKGVAKWVFPLALSDPTGSYTLCVRDIPTGLSAEAKLEVR